MVPAPRPGLLEEYEKYLAACAEYNRQGLRASPKILIRRGWRKPTLPRAGGTSAPVGCTHQNDGCDTSKMSHPRGSPYPLGHRLGHPELRPLIS
jgi:hypothetical protein